MPGIDDYDKLMTVRGPKGERDALAPYIAGNEPIVSRHWASDIWGEDGYSLTKPGFGVAICTTDRQVVVLGQIGGMIKPKYKVLVAPFTRCAGAGSTVRELHGRPAFLGQLRFTDGEAWTVHFHTREASEVFSSDLAGAIGGYRIINRLGEPAVAQAEPVAAASAPPHAAAGWADPDAIRAEWPQSRLNPQADLRSWQEGLLLYENDDYPSMMRCATSLSAALAHSLYGDGIVRGDDLPETVHKVLYSSLCAPPDGRTFAETAQRAARLALTIIRENGWQPADMGGHGLFDPLITDRGNYMLLAAAIAPDGRPWEGDLKAFFAFQARPI